MSMFGAVVAFLLVKTSFGFSDHRLPNAQNLISGLQQQRSMKPLPHQNAQPSLQQSTYNPRLLGVGAFLSLLAPSIAGAVDAAPIDVFTDPAILKQAIGGLVVGVAWIVPYLIFNLIIAPKMGLVVDDPVNEAKNENRDFF